jgi:hypothetical protein
MKNFFIGLVSICLIITAGSCKKTNSVTSGNNNNLDSIKPLSTAAGIPTGNSTSKVIGANGGSITSTDGSVELNIPAGALPGDTTITMQPITNNCPGGVLSAYRFTPNGLKFNKAAILKFHYPDSTSDGAVSQFMGMAVQDSLGFWRATSKFTNDTTAHTFTASIVHFTDYSLLELVTLTPGFKAVKVNEQINFVIKLVIPKDDESTAISGDDFNKILLYQYSENFQDIVWSVNGVQHGDPQYGSFTKELISGQATYTAPSKVPDKNNPVQVSAAFNLSLSYNNQIYNKIIVFSYVLISDVGYHVTLTFEAEVNESGTYWHWTDTGRFDVLMAGNVGAVEKIKNGGATIKLDSSNTTCTVTLAPPFPPIGPIYIVDSATVFYNSFDSSINVSFNSLTAKNYITFPAWNYDCGFGNTGQLGGGTGPPFPAIIQFSKSSAVLQTIILTPQYKMEVALIE